MPKNKLPSVLLKYYLLFAIYLLLNSNIKSRLQAIVLDFAGFSGEFGGALGLFTN